MPDDGATDALADANMERSSALQAEWNELREEMESLVKSMGRGGTSAQRERKMAITVRMTEIPGEMSAVLESAKEKLPPEDAPVDEDTAPVYSRRKLHRIERTYDSSDSEGPPPSRAAIDFSLPADADASPGARVLVESPTSRVRNEFTVLTALGTKLRSTLRKPESPKSAGSSPTALSDDERERLKLEESRLEREMRKLKREEPDSPRAAEVAARLKEITDLTLDEPTPQEDAAAPGHGRGTKAAAKSFLSPHKADSGRSPSARAHHHHKCEGAHKPHKSDSARKGEKAETPVSPGGFGGTNALVKKQTKRGLAGVKALGKKLMANVPKGTGAKSDAGTPSGSSSALPGGSQSGMKGGSPAGVADGNEFTELRDGLAKRGDNLKGVAEESAAMRESASDFAGAARALRKKKEKKGLFS